MRDAHVACYTKSPSVTRSELNQNLQTRTRARPLHMDRQRHCRRSSRYFPLPLTGSLIPMTEYTSCSRRVMRLMYPARESSRSKLVIFWQNLKQILSTFRCHQTCVRVSLGMTSGMRERAGNIGHSEVSWPQPHGPCTLGRQGWGSPVALTTAPLPPKYSKTCCSTSKC